MKTDLTKVTVDQPGEQIDLVIRRNDLIVIELEEGHALGGKIRLHVKDGKLIINGDRSLHIAPEVSNVIKVGLEAR